MTTLAGSTDRTELVDEHLRREFLDQDVDATMRTMVEEPYVHCVPTLSGGVGQNEVYAFNRDRFIGHWPADTTITPVSRTADGDRVVDELVIGFTHDRVMDYILPGVPPTGRRIEVAHVVIMCFKDGKIANEHVYWDQASVLVQAGLVDPADLPATGAEQAQRLLSLPDD